MHILGVLLFLYPLLQAPQAAPQPLAPAMRENLKVLVLEGKDSVNDIQRGLPALTVVEVRDENDLPVESAEVTFRLPPSGPGGMFPGGKLSQTVRTNLQGQAAARGFTPNNETGAFDIQATAIHGASMGRVIIPQSNAREIVAKPVQKTSWTHLSRGKLILLGALAAGGIAGGIFAARGGGSATSSVPVITVTPGPVAIGGPR